VSHEIVEALDAAWRLGDRDPDHPICKGIHFGVRAVCAEIGRRMDDLDDKRRLLLWLEAHR
jgi:hypothetical protein